MAILTALGILIFRSIPFINQCDPEVADDFKRHLGSLSGPENLHRAIAEKMAKKCYKLVSACGEDQVDYIQEAAIVRRDLCEYLELISGPVGECFDFMRDELDTQLLTRCVWNSSDTKFQDSFKSYFSSDFYDLTCDSVFHPCSKTQIKTNCKPGISELIDLSTSLLEKAKCGGIRFYDSRDIHDYYITQVFTPDKTFWVEKQMLTLTSTATNDVTLSE